MLTNNHDDGNSQDDEANHDDDNHYAYDDIQFISMIHVTGLSWTIYSLKKSWMLSRDPCLLLFVHDEWRMGDMFFPHFVILTAMFRSMSTCRFAQRVAAIKNNATVNEAQNLSTLKFWRLHKHQPKELDPALLIRRLKKEAAELKVRVQVYVWLYSTCFCCYMLLYLTIFGYVLYLAAVFSTKWQYQYNVRILSRTVWILNLFSMFQHVMIKFLSLVPHDICSTASLLWWLHCENPACAKEMEA